MCKKELLYLKLPLDVYTTKSKTKKSKYILNLNNFRNAHFRKNNTAKKIYTELVGDILPYKGFKLPSKKKTFRFEYTLFPKTRRRTDVANPLSIIDKFTCDALVEFNVIKDDDYNIISAVNYKFGSVDKNNPRAELRVYYDF